MIRGWNRGKQRGTDSACGDKRFFSKTKVAVLMLLFVGVLCTLWAQWQHPARDDAVRLQFVGLTNLPALGPRALFQITNGTDTLICVMGYGHVEPGEAVIHALKIPDGTGPWHASIKWQCLDFSTFDVTMNRLRRNVEEALGLQRMVDPWFPRSRMSQSAEVPR